MTFIHGWSARIEESVIEIQGKEDDSLTLFRLGIDRLNCLLCAEW